jgi:NTE family protein
MPETKEITRANRRQKVGLVLSGGGARGAYQAGVIKGIAQIAKEAGIDKPLPIITGVSAGAINASYLAATCENFEVAAEKMAALWCGITADQVFRTDALAAGRSGLRFLSDITVGAMYRRKLARSLLDTSPLRKLLNASIPFENIQKNILAGHLDALAVSAMNYTTSNSITFVQGHDQIPMWTRSRRFSTRTDITADHVMASAAIPVFFPPGPVADDHYGDGCLRNTAPLSPAIHLGADRLLVVSVRRPDSAAVPETTKIEPSLARIIGVILNALLLDAVEIDMERMSRVNQTLSHVSDPLRESLQLRQVDFLWIRPSQDIGHLAGELYERLPRVIKYLVSGLGSHKEAAELTSYLLFDPEFCGRLVQLGYDDAMASRDSIRKFLINE